VVQPQIWIRWASAHAGPPLYQRSRCERLSTAFRFMEVDVDLAATPFGQSQADVTIRANLRTADTAKGTAAWKRPRDNNQLT